MTKEKEAIFEQFSQYVQQYKAALWQSLDMVTVLGKREGIYFWDENGKRFINCHCNGGVFNLGHRNPEVRQALIDGMDIAMIPTFLACRLLVALGWLHTRKHTAFVQEHQSDLTNLGMVVIRGYVQSNGKEVSKFSKLKFVKELISGRIEKLFWK